MAFGWHSGFGEKWQRKQLALSFEEKNSEKVSLYAVNSSFYLLIYHFVRVFNSSCGKCVTEI